MGKTGRGSEESAPKTGKPLYKTRGVQPVRRMRTQWPSNEKLQEIIFKCNGVMSEVAKALKINVRTIYRRYDKDERFRRMFLDARDRILDIAESQLHKKVKRGNMAAIIFTLKCHGKDRGYVERSELTGARGKPLFDPLEEAKRASEGIRAALGDEAARKTLAEMQRLIDAAAARARAKRQDDEQEAPVLLN